jgi:hypothetical protein
MKLENYGKYVSNLSQVEKVAKKEILNVKKEYSVAENF